MRGMAKRPSSTKAASVPSPARRKTLSAANLAALGADVLAELLIDATAGDANLKRGV